MKNVLKVGQAEKQLKLQLERGEVSALHVELERAVGVDILETVSSDLYKNPFHVVRELIQNSYDENADNVELVVTGGSAVVKDNGRGMDLGTLVATRRLSESEKVYNPGKYPGPVRGFRKLGIYSGYQIAKGLELRTKQVGKDFELTLHFDFEQMRREVVKNRARSESDRWDFKLLVENCTYVRGEKVESVRVNESYTLAQLIDVEGTDPDAWARLSNVKELAKYLVETFSLDFDKTFKHRASINAYLRTNVPGFHPFTIKLYTADGEQILKRSAIADVDEVRPVKIPTNAKHPLAIGWIGRRKDRALEDSSARGIVFKVGGITIGRRKAGSGGATTDHGYFYDRLTGEFHVIDSDIKPDPERADFNPSAKTERLRAACEDVVRDFVREAREDRKASTEQRRSEKRVRQLVQEWGGVKLRLDAQDLAPEERRELLRSVALSLDELKAAQIAVSPSLADDAIKNTHEMETMLARAWGSQPVAKAKPGRGKASLEACLTAEERHSSSTVMKFVHLVGKVLWEQRREIGDLYEGIMRTIKERWVAARDRER